jgi:hypothetical protein
MSATRSSLPWPASHARSRRSSSPRSTTPIIALLVFLGLFSGGIGLGQLMGMPTLSELASSWSSGSVATHGGELGRSVPTKVSIPALGVRAKVVEVGKAADGSIAVPSTDPVKATGWYALGPAPGERGTAVIVGHVDTSTEPAVFHKLGELRKGKLIEVNRADRRIASFKVDSVETVPKTAFPADRVFQAADRPRLVLVTCGGPWLGGQVGYADNVIVYATLA